MKLTEQTKKLVQAIKDHNLITEKEINLIKNRLNNDKIDANSIPFMFDPNLDLPLENSQVMKGLNWIKNYFFMKNGQLRSTHSLHSEVTEIIKNAETVTFAGYSDQSNQCRKYYTPMYTVKHGSTSVTYYMNGGSVKFC